MAFNIRTPLLEVDFLNKIINEESRYLDQDTGTIKVAPGGRRVAFDDTASERFLAAAIDPFWHSAKDQLDFFQYYDDGTYFCQRKKLKTDFTTNTQYFATYQFSDGTADQAKQLYEQIKIFLEVANQVKNLKVEALVEEVDKEVLLYEKRYLKLKRQKNSLLELSDWRILPDVEDSWEGEKEKSEDEQENRQEEEERGCRRQRGRRRRFRRGRFRRGRGVGERGRKGDQLALGRRHRVRRERF